MKASIKYLVMTVVLMISFASHSESVRDGGMSGGGGGTAPGTPINSRDVIYALWSTRLELYLYFNRLSIDENVNDPLMGSLKDKMLPVIAKNAIHASFEGCKDKFGNDKDGSIYSKHANAICISIPNMLAKLHKDNMRLQLLALVAHEYSHLAGLEETDANAVQTWVLSSFSYGSGDLFTPFEELDLSFGMIRVHADEAKTATTWNELCYIVEEIDREFSKIRSHFQSGSYSVFDMPGLKRFASFQLRDHLLKSVSCGSSDYHPHRDRLLRNYNSAFGSQDRASDSELEKAFWGNEGSVAGNLIIPKVISVAGGIAEMNELALYAEQTLAQMKALQEMRQEPLY